MLSISCIIPEESHLWSVNDLHEIPWFLPNFYPLGFKKFYILLQNIQIFHKLNQFEIFY